MPIPPEINEIIQRLNQELNQIEQDATEALNLLQPRLNLFPNNPVVVGLFAAIQNRLYQVEVERRRIRDVIADIEGEDVSAQSIQSAGEDLGLILGKVVETKVRISSILNDLRG